MQTKKLNFTTKAALNADTQTTVKNGVRQTLKRGDSVTFTDLPNQPIALVAYNNTGNTTPYIVSYNNAIPKAFDIESVQGQGFSLGNAFLLNPQVTGAKEISVSVPNTAQGTASIDVYLVSLLLPMGGINNIEIPLNGDEKVFSGYSRAFATPPLAWYQMSIRSTFTGLVGFIFMDKEIITVAVNTPASLKKNLESKIYFNATTGIKSNEVIVTPGSTYDYSFYGVSSQIVYSPVSSARTTDNGNISILKIG